MLGIGVCLPQPCSSAGRRFARQNHVYITTDELFRFHNNELDEYFLNWILLRILVRLETMYKINNEIYQEIIQYISQSTKLITIPGCDVYPCCVFMDVCFVLYLFCLFTCVCVCL